MILTCTFNPSVDYLVTLNEIKIGEVNRLDFEKYVIGGKGINVSIILNSLSIKSRATGFIGGFTGEYFENELKKYDYIDSKLIKVNGTTRINTKINHINYETEINGKGCEVTEEDFEQLKKELLELTHEDYFVLSGSVANGLNENAYEELAKICFERNITFAVDTTKDNLKQTLKYKPFLIKPNHHELSEFFNIAIESDDEIIKYGLELQKLGAQNVLISQGKKGAILITDDGIYKSEKVDIETKRTVGAGDSMVGGFIGSYSIHKDLVKAFEVGTNCAVATASSQGIANRMIIKELSDKIIIKKIR